MSQADQNIEKTKAGYAAFSAQDVEAALTDIADDIEWVVPGNSAVSGTYRGKDEVVGFWMKLAEKGFTVTPQHFFGDDERVVVLCSTTAGGETSDSADVLTFRDGKVVRFQTAGDTALQERVWGTQ